MFRRVSSRIAGISAIGFGCYAIGAVFWMIVQDVWSGKGGGGGPVALPVPSIWFIGLAVVVISLPWIVTGGLLFTRLTIARVFAWILVIPTLYFGGYAGFEYLDIVRGVCFKETNPWVLVMALPFVPPAAFGFAYCVALCASQLSLPPKSSLM